MIKEILIIFLVLQDSVGNQFHHKAKSNCIGRKYMKKHQKSLVETVKSKAETKHKIFGALGVITGHMFKPDHN